MGGVENRLDVRRAPLFVVVVIGRVPLVLQIDERAGDLLEGQRHGLLVTICLLYTSVRGRMIQDTDDKQSPLVVLVDETAARHFWGAQDPLGKRIRSVSTIRRGIVQPTPWFTVVGVVGNVKLASLDEKDVPHVYTSLYQTSEMCIRDRCWNARDLGRGACSPGSG